MDVILHPSALAWKWFLPMKRYKQLLLKTALRNFSTNMTRGMYSHDTKMHQRWYFLSYQARSYEFRSKSESVLYLLRKIVARIKATCFDIHLEVVAVSMNRIPEFLLQISRSQWTHVLTTYGLETNEVFIGHKQIFCLTITTRMASAESSIIEGLTRFYNSEVEKEIMIHYPALVAINLQSTHEIANKFTVGLRKNTTRENTVVAAFLYNSIVWDIIGEVYKGIEISELMHQCGNTYSTIMEFLHMANLKGNSKQKKKRIRLYKLLYCCLSIRDSKRRSLGILLKST